MSIAERITFCWSLRCYGGSLSFQQPLGQSIYLGAAYSVGRMYAPDAATIMRQDVLFGLLAETPLGVITVAPAIGTDGHRKLVFTLGKLF